jgi:hypothetical protein
MVESHFKNAQTGNKVSTSAAPSDDASGSRFWDSMAVGFPRGWVMTAVRALELTLPQDEQDTGEDVAVATAIWVHTWIQIELQRLVGDVTTPVREQSAEPTSVAPRSLSGRPQRDSWL